MRFRVRIKGTGTATLAAQNSVDAERTLEKELTRALPGGVLDVREIRRMDETPRIVKEFALTYVLTTEEDVEAEDEEGARPAAFRSARKALEGTRFARVAWDPKVAVVRA